MGASVNQGGTSEITRSLTEQVTENSTTVVHLDIMVGPDTECPPENKKECNDFYVIEEEIPGNVKVLDVQGRKCELIEGNPHRLICIVLQNTYGITMKYTILVPNKPTVLGFNGLYMFQGDEKINQIGGDTVMKVITPRTCTPDWTCDDWEPEECINGTLQIRECTDKNNCNSDVNRPLEEQICTSEKQQKKAKFGGHLGLLGALILILIVALMLFGSAYSTKKLTRKKRKR